MLVLTDIIKIELLQNIFYLIISSFFYINVFLFLLLITQKLYIEYKDRTLQKLKNLYSNQILEIILGKDKKIVLHKNIEFQAFAEVASELLTSISGEFNDKILKILNDSGTIKYYIKKTNSKNWLKRIEAVEILGSFRIDYLQRDFLQLLKKEKKSYVKTQILQSISMICSKDSLKILMDEIIKTKNLSGKFLESIFSNIIQSLKQRNEEKYFVDLMKNIKDETTIPEEIKKSMIEACGSSMLFYAKDVILDYYKTFQNNPYIKITCIRSLGKMSIPEVCSIVKEALYDEKWEIKAVACKYAFLCPHLYPILSDLLEDANFYVRRNAALTLAESDEGLKILKEKLFNTSDKYTKDLINSILKLKQNA